MGQIHSQDLFLPELQGKAGVHQSSLVTTRTSADMTYTAGLLTQQVQGDTQTQAGANKKPGEEQGSILCTPQKMPPVGSKPLCVGRHSPLGRTKSMLLSGMGSVHTIVAAVMTSVTKQDKLHLVPVP